MRETLEQLTALPLRLTLASIGIDNPCWLCLPNPFLWLQSITTVSCCNTSVVFLFTSAFQWDHIRDIHMMWSIAPSDTIILPISCRVWFTITSKSCSMCMFDIRERKICLVSPHMWKNSICILRWQPEMQLFRYHLYPENSATFIISCSRTPEAELLCCVLEDNENNYRMDRL